MQECPRQHCWLQEKARNKCLPQEEREVKVMFSHNGNETAESSAGAILAPGAIWQGREMVFWFSQQQGQGRTFI